MPGSARAKPTVLPINYCRRCATNSAAMSNRKAESIVQPVSVLVVMGVSGCGKSTVAPILSAQLGWEYVDGDEFHPRSNVEKMHRGTPLTDADRLPWLKAIAAWIDDKA